MFILVVTTGILPLSSRFALGVTVRARKPRRPDGRRGFRARTVTTLWGLKVYGHAPSYVPVVRLEGGGGAILKKHWILKHENAENFQNV